MLSLFNNPLSFLVTILAFLAAITVHEFAHAFMAERLGDPTPRLMGRLSLNPLRHLDLIGTLMILFAPFGWAKPVQIDPFNFRNPKRDSALTSLAGPLANLTLAILMSLVLRILGLFTFVDQSLLGAFLAAFVKIALIMNVNLAVFNLIPIHPLDGFAIVRGMLPDEYARQWQELESYGFIFLLFLIFPVFGGTSPIGHIMSPIINMILTLLLPTGRII